VDLIDPSIDVTKTGPASAKAGDTITYTIGFTDTSAGGVLENCTGNDDVIGPLGAFTAGVPRNFNYTVQVGDPDPLVNIATITCDVAGFDNQASDNDTHSVDLIDPSIDVTKTGPAIAKRGDTITYTIGFTNTGSGTLENCTGTDTVLGTLGAFTAGVNRTFDYTVQAGDPDPLPNTATITCDVAGFDNTASDSDDHSVDLINPSVDLTKECTPDPVAVGGTINWAITVDNTGDIDLDCLVNDPTAGYTNEPVTVAAGGSEALAAGATVEAGDGPVISNTASVNCQIAGFDNSVSDSDTADCEVTVINELCRTPGFWKTHGGAEKAGRSTNLVWEVIDWTPGDTLGTICGVEIDNTSVNGYEDVPAIMTGNGDGSALEGMCVHPKTKIVRQLQRQLIAASLNCVASGGSADCTGISVYQDWMDANAACTTVANGGVADLSSFIDTIDAFNNGEAPFTCTENIGDSIVFEGVDYKVPGPAGSSNACSEATYNDFYLVPLP
jgi:hypothetical protein